MYYTSHWSWKCRTVSMTLPSLTSNSTNQPTTNPDENQQKFKGVTISPSQYLAVTPCNEQTTQSNLQGKNQHIQEWINRDQPSQKGRSVSRLQKPNQPALEGGSQTHTRIYQNTCYFKVLPQSIKQPGIFLPRGQIPKHRSCGFSPWLSEIPLSHHLLRPAPRVCNLCSVYVFHVSIHMQRKTSSSILSYCEEILNFSKQILNTGCYLYGCTSTSSSARFPATNHLYKSHFPRNQCYISASYCPYSSCITHNEPSYPIFNYFPGCFPVSARKHKVFGFFQT